MRCAAGGLGAPAAWLLAVLFVIQWAYYDVEAGLVQQPRDGHLRGAGAHLVGHVALDEFDLPVVGRDDRRTALGLGRVERRRLLDDIQRRVAGHQDKKLDLLRRLRSWDEPA